MKTTEQKKQDASRWSSNRIRRLRAEGRCVACGARVEDGKWRCPSHRVFASEATKDYLSRDRAVRKKNREAATQRARRLHQARLCGSCGERCPDDKWRCETCRTGRRTERGRRNAS